MRVVFMGTPEFAVPSLEALVRFSFEVTLVVTAQDAPIGRGLHLSAPPVKGRAISLGLEVYQPEKASSEESLARIREARPDVIAVVAYGQILKPACLAIPTLGCINVHASLLPKYRGAAPIQHALMNGEEVTGMTTIFMNERMDAGDIILQRQMPIYPEDDCGTLSERLSQVGAELLVETLRLVEKGEAPRLPQDEAQATYAPMIRKETTVIDWGQSAVRIHNLVRAMSPKPGAQTFWRGQVVKVWRARPVTELARQNAATGEVIRAQGQELLVCTEDGAIQIEELQLEGHKRLKADEWMRGTRIKEGERFEGQPAIAR